MNNLIQELRRRKVFRVAGMYALVAWIIMQIGEVTFPALLLPDWTLTLVIVLLIIGFPIAILLSWAFDITPEGIKRDRTTAPEETARSVATFFNPPQKPATKIFRLSITFAAIVALAAISWLILPQMGLFGLQAPADTNSLAVLNFENLQDTEDRDRLGQILQELIITDLSESETFKVFSSQRLYDLQNQLGYTESRDIDPSVALEVARMAGAATMLTGNIIQTGGKTILTSRLIEVDRGTVIKSQRVEGNDIYAMVDDLTNLVRADLNLSSNEAKDIQIPVIEKTTASMTAYQHYLEGMQLFNEQKFDAAIDHFTESLAVDSNFTDVYYPLAMAQWWAQSVTKEVTSADALLTLNEIITGKHYKTTKEKLLAEGAWELVQQNFEKAADLYRQLVGFLPDEKDGWYGLGEALFHGYQDYDGAKEAFERVLNLDPNYKLAYRHIFDIYNAKELYTAGKMVAIQFLDLFPESAWGPYYLGLMNSGMDDFEKAAELYTDAIEIDPNFEQAYNDLIHLCRIHIDHQDCLQLANNLITIHPDSPYLYRLQGHIYRNAEDYSAALRSYQTGLQVDPGFYQFITSIGYTYQLMGLYDTAEKEYRKLLDEEKGPTWNNSGISLLNQLYIEQGKYSLAIQNQSERLQNRPEYRDQAVNSAIGLAFINFMSDNYQDAHATLDEAIALGPSAGERMSIYLIRGLLYATQNNEEQLTQLLNIVTNSRPATSVENSLNNVNITYQSLLFQYHFMQNEFTEAIQVYETIKDVKEVATYYLYQLALIHMRSGNYELALKTTEKMQNPLLNVDPRAFIYPRSFYLRGQIYEAMGNLTLARQSYQKLLSIWRDADENNSIRQDLLNRLIDINQRIG